MNGMKIYKIIDNTNGNVYIGKTKNTLNYRLRKHKSNRTCSSRLIIDNGDYRIELIEETEDDSRERYWIENTECVNVCIPGRTDKEWREKNKNYAKEHRQKNIDKVREYDRMRSRWKSSMGGDPYQNNMSLLKIHPDLFL
tara:strand:- start:433 stop:852 length:420 start_codon:yes stop_codon:yes gene_type:complete